MTRHRFDPFSFIAGAVSVALAAAVLVGQVTIDLLDLRIAGPLLVLVLGLSLLLGGGRDRPLAASGSDERPDSAAPGGTDDAERATEEATEPTEEGAEDTEAVADGSETEEREIDEEASEA